MAEILAEAARFCGVNFGSCNGFQGFGVCVLRGGFLGCVFGHGVVEFGNFLGGFRMARARFCFFVASFAAHQETKGLTPED